MVDERKDGNKSPRPVPLEKHEGERVPLQETTDHLRPERPSQPSPPTDSGESKSDGGES